MSEQIYKALFDEALNQIHKEYIENGSEGFFKVWFNLEYVEDTFDSITVSVPSEAMWKLMQQNGSVAKIQQKIFEFTAQEISLIPLAKNAQNITKKVESQQTVFQQNTIQNSSYQTTSIQNNSFSQKIESQRPNTENQNLQNNENLTPFEKAMKGLENMIAKQREIEGKQLEQNSVSSQNQPMLQQNQQSQNNEQKNQKTLLNTENHANQDLEYQKLLEAGIKQLNQISKPATHPSLRDDYTFENFVPGTNSQYAYSASKRAAETPGKDYNPMLIYGGVGLGKTHLMQAIGNYIYAHNNNAKICYISAEAFTNEFFYSIRDKKTEDFKKKYRNLDVLLLDDIQFLTEKEATQEELFYAFNEIYDRKGQLVFTCDRPIDEIKKLTDRLKTRFTRGVTIDLQPPDYETRRAILEQKMTSRGKSIPSDVVDYIAQHIQSNVRDLEGCMNKMIGYIELIGQDLTIETAKELLKDKISSITSSGNVTIESIQKAVARYYGLKHTDLIGKKKSKQYILPRQIAIYLSRKLMSEYSLKDIGSAFGGRDHTTIISAIDKVELQVKTKPDIVGILEQLEKDAHEIS